MPRSKLQKKTVTDRKNPLIHRESAVITMDHSNYCMDVDHDTQKKSITERKKILSSSQLYN